MDSWKDCGKEYDFNPETEHYRTETEAEVYLIKANLPQTLDAYEQAQGRTPAQYETKEDYIAAKMAFYEFLDGSTEPEGKA